MVYQTNTMTNPVICMCTNFWKKIPLVNCQLNNSTTKICVFMVKTFGINIEFLWEKFLLWYISIEWGIEMDWNRFYVQIQLNRYKWVAKNWNTEPICKRKKHIEIYLWQHIYFNVNRVRCFVFYFLFSCHFIMCMSKRRKLPTMNSVIKSGSSLAEHV